MRCSRHTASGPIRGSGCRSGETVRAVSGPRLVFARGEEDRRLTRDLGVRTSEKPLVGGRELRQLHEWVLRHGCHGCVRRDARATAGYHRTHSNSIDLPTGTDLRRHELLPQDTPLLSLGSSEVNRRSRQIIRIPSDGRQQPREAVSEPEPSYRGEEAAQNRRSGCDGVRSQSLDSTSTALLSLTHGSS